MDNDENMITHVQWLKLSLHVPQVAIDAVCDLLGVLSGCGVEQRPASDGGSTISAFFRLDRERETIAAEVGEELKALFALYRLPVPELAGSVLADEDWATSWQQYFHTFEIIPGLFIKPSWEDYVPGPGEHLIEMDPGQAFGTGQHASTRMALSLVAHCLAVGPVAAALDVGTGTGILAMAAVSFGVPRVTAIDNDPEAVRVAKENVAANSMADRIDVATTPLAEIGETFPLILANIVHDVLMDMLPDFVRLTGERSRLVLAGILRDAQEKSIVQAYAGQGFRLVKTLHQEEWAALLLERS